METSARLLHRRLVRLHSFSPSPRGNHNPRIPRLYASLPVNGRRSLPFLSLSFSASQCLIPCHSFAASVPTSGTGGGGDGGGGGAESRDLGFRSGAAWTVVLLGWLGAEPRHLNRYAEIYGAKGIRTVRFVVPVRDTLGIDLGRRVQERVAGLVRELMDWCSQREEDGRERRLLFHTFSNTGWLTYGEILDKLQSRRDIVDKIQGCVIDSGPAPEIDPQVWAAGFCAALLRRRNSLTHTSAEAIEGGKMDGDNSRLNTKEKTPLSLVIFSGILENFFSILLRLPNVNKKLSKIIFILSKNQPPCPQLYLYSTADRVIPAHSVEAFIQEQKAQGRTVRSYNFGSSSHVDHWRSFPHIYSSQVNEFLEECCLPMDIRI